MAKVGARGAVKLAEVRREVAPDTELVLVLRSDGQVLERTRYVDSRIGRWRSTEYRVRGQFQTPYPERLRERFLYWAERRGFHAVA